MSKKRRKRYYSTHKEEESGKIRCPVCLELFEEKEGHRHHTHPHFAGGHGHHWNLVLICANCHAIITFGGGWRLQVYDRICTFYMMANYGYLYCLQRGTYFRESFEKLSPKPRNEWKDKKFSWWKEQSNFLKNLARERYCFWQAMRQSDNPGQEWQDFLEEEGE